MVLSIVFSRYPDIKLLYTYSEAFPATNIDTIDTNIEHANPQKDLNAPFRNPEATKIIKIAVTDKSSIKLFKKIHRQKIQINIYDKYL